MYLFIQLQTKFHRTTKGTVTAFSFKAFNATMDLKMNLKDG